MTDTNTFLFFYFFFLLPTNIHNNISTLTDRPPSNRHASENLDFACQMHNNNLNLLRLQSNNEEKVNVILNKQNTVQRPQLK